MIRTTVLLIVCYLGIGTVCPAQLATSTTQEPTRVAYMDVMVSYMTSAFVNMAGAFYVPPEYADAFSVCNLTAEPRSVWLEWVTADGRTLHRTFFLEPGVSGCEYHKPVEADRPTRLRWSWKKVGQVDQQPSAVIW